jgi:hypothetical protein
MARLIDANALIKEANKEGAYGYVDALQIANAPTIDAVEVVRCKDCKYWGNEETKVATVCEFPCVQLFCVCDVLKRMRKAGNCMTNEDFFCAHGEKRRADFVDDNKIGERKNDV